MGSTRSKGGGEETEKRLVDGETHQVVGEGNGQRQAHDTDRAVDEVHNGQEESSPAGPSSRRRSRPWDM